jgi:hypothetical protein
MAYLYYPLNGFLAFLWLLLDHIFLVLLGIPLIGLGTTTPKEQRSWILGTSALALLASAVAPAPVPLLLLLMAASGWLATRLEKFNTIAVYWNAARGLAIYSLAGLGFTAFQALASGMESSPWLAQGQVYLSSIAAFAMYLIPLGYLALLVQTLFAHPPIQGKPGELIHTIRSRGKGP